VIHKLRLTKFKKQVKDELINISEFDFIYKQIIEENKEIYKKNRREIRKLEKIKAKDYFDELTLPQKIKFSSLAPRYGEEQEDEYHKEKKKSSIIKKITKKKRNKIRRKRISKKFIKHKKINKVKEESKENYDIIIET